MELRFMEFFAQIKLFSSGGDQLSIVFLLLLLTGLLSIKLLKIKSKLTCYKCLIKKYWFELIHNSMYLYK